MASDEVVNLAERALLEEAKRLSVGLPKMLDENQSLDSVEANGSILTYTITLVEINATDSKEFFDMLLADDCVQKACTEMRPHLKNGAQIKYVFLANDGSLLTEIVVTSQDCDI